MFNSKNVPTDDSKVSHQDLSQEKDYTIENIPIHTMAKDMQATENPAMKNVLYPEKPVTKIVLSELTAAQKSSPFLNPSEKAIFADEPRVKSNPDYRQVNKAIQPKLDPISITKTPTGSNFLPLIIILFIILVVGAGTYYFITTRETTSVETIVTPENNNISEEPIREIVVPPAPVATETPKYLVINTATVDTGLVKKELEKNSQEVMASELSVPVEFIVVDLQNNPIGFADFARMADLTLSEKIIALLEKDFHLFFFNDHGNAGVALQLKAIDVTLLQQQFRQEEPLLSKELTTMLLYANFAPPTTTFQSNQYKNTEVRYQNLISPQKLSIDYAFQGKNLLLATTKLTMEVLLDKLSSQ